MAIRTAVSTFLMVTALSATAHGALSLQLVAMQGTPLLGTTFGAFPSFYYPGINAQGDVIFPGDPMTGAIFVYSGGNFVLVAAPANQFGSNNIYSTVISQSQQQGGPTLFLANAQATGLLGLYARQFNGTTSLLVDANTPVPGMTNVSFLSGPVSPANNATMNLHGDYVFSGRTTGDTGLLGGVWASQNGKLTLAAHSGLQVPNQAPGVTWTSIVNLPSIAGNGTVFFNGTMSNGLFGTFTYDGTSVAPLVLANQPVPGIPGTNFGPLYFVQTHPNNNGDVAFNDKTSIWLKNSTGYNRVASAGTPIVGGGNLSNVAYADVHLSDNGDVIFNAGFNGHEGLFVSQADGIHAIAMFGQATPAGAPANTEFLDVYDPEINSRGQVAFLADLTNPATGNITRSYLFATEPDGSLVYVAGAGTTVSGGGLSYTAAAAGLYSAQFQDIALTEFSDNGDLVFTLNPFQSNTPGAVVLAHLNAPEPATMGMLAVGAAGLLMRRRRGR